MTTRWLPRVSVLLLAACGGTGGPGGGAADASAAADATPDPGDVDAALPGSADAGSAGTADAAPGSGADAGGDAACANGATFLPLPADTSAPGPWPVGARTASVGRLTVEVWYPAVPGSEVGEADAIYDIREQLPPSQQSKIADADNPLQTCDCARDLPIDADHGPYPLVAFVHGTAGFRTQSLTLMTHWASRGFIVVAADHPGLKLADILAGLCPDQASGSQDLASDVDVILGAVSAATGPLAFLDGHADMDRVAVTGHSAGGNAAANLTDRAGVRVSIPMASNTAPRASSTLASSLLLGALSDTVVAYSGTQSAYGSAPVAKRLVGIDNSGHLAFSDLCELQNDRGENIVKVAQDNGVCGVIFAGFLFDCKPTYLSADVRNDIIEYSTSAVLEGVLMCSDAEDNFASLRATYPDVAELKQDL